MVSTSAKVSVNRRHGVSDSAVTDANPRYLSIRLCIRLLAAPFSTSGTQQRGRFGRHSQAHI